MPNEETVYVPSNTWAHMGEGLCDNCSKPRDLYANSWVANLIQCAYCLTRALSDKVIIAKVALETLENTEAYAIAEPAYLAIRAEYQDVREKSDTLSRPSYIEGRCRVCYHPVVEGAYGSYAGKVSLDGDGNEYLAHLCCSEYCGECDRQFLTWNAISHNDLTLMSFERYFGTRRCLSCVEEVVESNGGADEFFYCEQCDSMEAYDHSGSYNGNRYCESCYDECVSVCSECEDSYWSDDGHYCDTRSLIHDYSYRPRPHFFGSGAYHFGFELEVESRKESKMEGATYAIDALGAHAYLKTDGSLNNGFEIVTHPHTLEEYQKKFNWGCMAGLGERGYRSWNTTTCGLHVHVSRTAFGTITQKTDILKAQSHELRFIKLIYDNQRQIERLAGRSSSYAKFKDKGQLHNRVKYGTQDDRYEAVNSQNSETLEVRVFKGSLKPERILSAIELVHASVEYTRDLKVSGSNNALKWIYFVRYVANNGSTYPNLVSMIQSTFDNDTPLQTDSDD